MSNYQLQYTGTQVEQAISNGLVAVTTESGQTLTPNQQETVKQKLAIPDTPSQEELVQAVLDALPTWTGGSY